MQSRTGSVLLPLVPAGSSILLGLSGGVDSVVLLHLLHRLSPLHSWRLSALHVHHGISPNADAWAEFCAALCARYDIPLQIERVDIAPLRGHGIEAAARKLRHAAFERQQADFIAFAHHQDDQAETLLLQLLRGAGVRGGAAMPFLRRQATSNPFPLEAEGWGGNESPALPRPPVVLRPLLDSSRSELLGYARQHALQWVEDESNSDDGYPRNFLRQRVLPLLEQHFPACRETLARTARHFAEASELLDQLAQQDTGLRGQEMAGDSEPTLEIARLHALSPLRAKNAMRYFLHVRGAPMPQAVQLDEMLRQVIGAREDSMMCVEFGGWQLRRYQGRAYALPALPPLDGVLRTVWAGEEELAWPPLDSIVSFTRTQGAGISLEQLSSAQVTLRLRSGGETLRPGRNAATRTLKNLMQQHHVPPWRRERLPLLYCGDALACVAGVAVAADFLAQPGEAGVVVRLGSALQGANGTVWP